jgi:hypothetical protein
MSQKHLQKVLFVVVMLFLFSCKKQSSNNNGGNSGGGANPPPVTYDWSFESTPVWTDEFNTDGVPDATK